MASEPGIAPLSCGVDSQKEAQVRHIGRKDAITEAESALRLHLERSLKTRLQASPCKPHCWFYYGFHDFVLREGRFFTPHPPHRDLSRAPAGEPCLNSLTNSASKRLYYVEGYALAEAFSLPAPHAWNSDDHGLVVDRTWDPVGLAYFGVAIPDALVLAAPMKHGICSLIDNWHQHWPLLQRPWSKTLAESEL